jgi:hypothetical protein
VHLAGSVKIGVLPSLVGTDPQWREGGDDAQARRLNMRWSEALETGGDRTCTFGYASSLLPPYASVAFRHPYTWASMKSREEHLIWAKRRALICADMGAFTSAVAGLRADLAANPLTKGVISSDQAVRGYKAAIDAALGRGSQALTEWIEGLR